MEYRFLHFQFVKGCEVEPAFCEAGIEDDLVAVTEMHTRHLALTESGSIESCIEQFCITEIAIIETAIGEVNAGKVHTREIALIEITILIVSGRRVAGCEVRLAEFLTFGI
jgi:hypothetical protein